jgi:hypothetical protein
MLKRLIMSCAAAMLLPAAAQSAESPLDYEFFKTRVQPIFLQKRPDHVRCYVCHSESNSAFKLEHLAKGSSAYTEEQTRKNFEVVSGLVVPGNPDASLLLMRPLVPQQGGFPYHSGGRQFESRDDPAWKTIAEWVKLTPASQARQ